MGNLVKLYFLITYILNIYDIEIIKKTLYCTYVSKLKKVRVIIFLPTMYMG